MEPSDSSNKNDTAQPVSLLERHNMVVARIRAGTLTIQDYQREFTRFVERREAVYREIDANVCDTLNQRWGLKWPERAVVERATLTRATFMGLLYDYLLLRVDTHSHTAFGEDVTDFVTEAFTMASKQPALRISQPIRRLFTKSHEQAATFEPTRCARERIKATEVLRRARRIGGSHRGAYTGDSRSSVEDRSHHPDSVTAERWCCRVAASQRNE